MTYPITSLIEGYSCDIFISYRQKDNKYDGWVTEFVDNLKKELETTFKEEISVYFDINPDNGLLETNDVDESLKEKLKCLVFIPIISRIYCDPKSFAWENEFLTFVNQASNDKFGLKIKLPNGNVVNRVLPIRIHDLDPEDIKQCESVLGGFLRGVEFIYKSSGVNRPLRSKEDKPIDNLYKTIYRDQINKVTLAIREIISGLKGEAVVNGIVPEKVVSKIEKTVLQEKSIIVLPFDNISPDPDQEYFSDGLTEEIITDLSHIKDLLVISRSSAMTFKGKKLTIPEIAHTVNVHYVLEGSVRKSGNNLRITAQLIDALTDTHLWANKYDGRLGDIFDIQEKVSRSIADALKLKLSPEEQKKLHERPIDDVSAYDCYLRASREIMSFSIERLDFGLKLLQNGIKIAGENALIYAGMAYAYFQYANFGIDQQKNIKEAEECLTKALNINSELAEAHFVLACINLNFLGNVHKAIRHFKLAYLDKPDNSDIITWLAFGYELVGKTEKAMPLVERLIRIDPTNPLNISLRGFVYFFEGKFDLAFNPLQEMYSFDSESPMWQLWKSLILIYNDRPEESYEFINSKIKEPAQDSLVTLLLCLKYAIAGDKEKFSSLLSPDFVKHVQMDCQLSWHLSAFYSYINEKTKSLDWLENAVNRGFINYPLLSEHDKLLNNVRGEERFKKLMIRAKFEWENFDL